MNFQCQPETIQRIQKTQEIKIHLLINKIGGIIIPIIIKMYYN